MKDIKILKIAQPLIQHYPWAIPLVITLGFLASLSEGLGISLFIPFLQGLDPTRTSLAEESRFITWLNQLSFGVSPEQQIIVIPALIFACIILKNTLAFTNLYLSSWLYTNLGHRLVSSVYSELLQLNYSFFDNNRSGKLLNTLQQQTWESCNSITKIISLITNTCTVIVFLTILLLTSWHLTLLVIVSMSLISIVLQGLSSHVKRLGLKKIQASDALAHQMLEGFSGMRTIRAFGRERYEQERFVRVSKQLQITSMRLYTFLGTVGPISETLSATLLLCILVVSLIYNKSSLPVLLTFVFFLYTLQPRIRQLDSDRMGLASLSPSIDNVLWILNQPEENFIKSGKRSNYAFNKSIRFKSVFFQYKTQNEPALEDVSFCIPKGKTIALVGPSGAGKSTIINLICRFYDPTEGQILIDQEPLQELDLAIWRNQIAIVSQDVHIFSSTIRENIAYGKLEATDDEIVMAAKYANAHEFITNLPYDYDTQVGDRGVRLSGGQKQRLALARAIVRDPKILILDEATNALDSISESFIQEAIEKLSQNRTVIVIAHRLSTIKKADQIIVIEKGKIVEKGSFQQLSAQDGLFSKMYRLQFSAV